MHVGNCGEVLCVLLLLFAASKQQTDGGKHNKYEHPAEFDGPLPKFSSNEHPRGTVGESADDTVFPTYIVEEENPEKLLQNPKLMKQIEDQLEDHDGNEFKDQQHNRKIDILEKSVDDTVFPTHIVEEENPEKLLQHPQLMKQIEDQLEDHDGKEYKNQQQNEKIDDLDGIIQKVFNLDNEQKHDTESHNLHIKTQLPVAPKEVYKQNIQRNSPVEIGLPQGNILERRRIMRKLKSPLRSSSSGYKSEQTSEEMLHDILESIDQDNSQHGDPIKNAFLKKTTTYNISKIHNHGRNRSFLIEKIVNYTTNIKILHPESIPTNYSDSRSSVVQTVMDLDKSRDSPNDNRIGNPYDSLPEENGESNDIVQSQGRSHFSNGETQPLKTPTQNQFPTDFVGGVYLKPHSNLPIEDSLSDKKHTNHEFSDFVGGQYVNPSKRKSDEPHKSKDSKNNLDFVGGQFIEQPLGSRENVLQTSSPDFETTLVQDYATNSPIVEFPSLSLTNEQKVSKEHPSSNILKTKGKTEENPILEEVSSEKANSKSKDSSRTNTISTKENDKNRAKSDIDSSEEKTLPSSTNNNDHDTLDESSDVENKSNNSYESTTIPGEMQDKAKNTISKTDLKKVKKTQNSPKYVLNEDHQNSMKAKSGEQKIIHANIPSDDSVLRAASEDDLNSGEEEVEEESEEYSSTLQDFVGLKPTKTYASIMKTDSTGHFVTEIPDDFSTDSTTQPSSLEDLEPLSTSGSNLKMRNMSPNPNTEFNPILGDVLDVQKSKVRSISSETEFSDPLSETESQEQNITNLVDEVKLFAGKPNESESVPKEKTTINPKSNILKKLSKAVEGNSSEKNTTELCFPISEDEIPTLLDLLSGKLYLEKNGKRTHLRLRDNPMKNCNSRSAVCKLFFDLEKNTEPSMSEEMFEPSDENPDKGLPMKSKNEKRQITEEYNGTNETNAENKTDEITTKPPEGVEISKELNENKITDTPLGNKSETTVSDLIVNKTETELSESSDKIKQKPEKALFIKLPVSFKGFEVPDQIPIRDSNSNQNNVNQPMNEKRITLHDLDSPYHSHGVLGPSPFLRKIHHKRNSLANIGGACGCNNPLLLSPSPTPDFRHFVGKRMTILKNIVHTIKDWATQDSLRA
ncbi:putative uncharacterized protein DDB_G0277255 isoform X2 [Macrosteles quadrilineatus]|nr:putative uncharacterized protein DDB_G0277255 isoform X2 [Macrosteles quadrilineatus]XP_054273226.1 putative uncharacterized protein DDB_G0277255 isoform X2 [Macrosteles quadrilineatus]